MSGAFPFNLERHPTALLPLHVHRLAAQPAVKTARADIYAQTANAYAADLLFKGKLAELHALALRPTSDLLGELGTNTMQATWVEAMVEGYVRVDPSTAQAHDRCPRLPLREARR